MNPLRPWLRERIPIEPEILRKSLREELPVHMKTWLFCLGGTPLILFGVLAATGILLTFAYVPHPVRAWQSVEAISYNIRMGWLIRGIHKGASHLMVIAVLLHMIRVFVTRAYRKPREFNWALGVALFLTTLSFAFTGYSLVYDQLSYWATTIGTNMIANLPWIGKPLLYLFRGGATVTPNTLTRFYSFHIGVLPTLMMLMIGAHIILVRLHRVSTLENDSRTETYKFMPNHVIREAIIGFLIVVGLINFAIFYPPTLGSPATPNITPGEIRPEWYFFPTYRWLKLTSMPVGIIGTLAFIIGLFFLPVIDVALEKIAPRRHLGTIIASAGFLVTLVLLVWESLAG